MISSFWFALAAAALPPLSPHYEEAAQHMGEPPAVYRLLPADQSQRSRALATSTAKPHKRVFGYLPYWTDLDPNDLQWDVLTDVAHFSVELGGQGQILDTHGWLPSGASAAPLVEVAHAHGAKAHLAAIVPGNIRGLLRNASSREAAIKAMVDLVVRGKADGLNLDIEPVPETHRQLYTDFVKATRAALDAAKPGIELTICVYALPQYYPGYDITALGEIADSLLVMSYNYYWPGSNMAGPVAPLDKGSLWKYSVKESFEPPEGHLARTGADKLMMGVAYFGYDWPTESATTFPSKNTGYGKARAYRNVMSRLPKGGAQWEPQSQTPFFGYTDGGTPHQIWYDDAKSLQAKYDYVNRRGMAGVMIWALGYDGARTELWESLRQKFVREPPPLPEAPSAPPASPAMPAQSPTPPSAAIPDSPPAEETPPETLPAQAASGTEADEIRGGCTALPGSHGWLLVLLPLLLVPRPGAPSTRSKNAGLGLGETSSS